MSAETGWKKVEMADFMRGLEILKNANPQDPKAMREAIRLANAEIGIVSPRQARKSNPADPDQ